MKSFRKILALLLVLAISAVCLTSCGGGSTTPANNNGGTSAIDENDYGSKIPYKHLGLAVPGLSSEFYMGLANSIEIACDKYGIELTIVSFEDSVEKEVTCIENLVTAGCDAIFFVANDPEGVTDVSRRYKEQGIFMIPYAGTFSDPTCYNVSITTAQYELGYAVAEACSKWIDERFPDAEPGTIGVCLLGARTALEFSLRMDGFNALPEINPKAKILEEYYLGDTGSLGEQGSRYAETAQVKYGTDCKAFLSLPGDCALGVAEAYNRWDGFEDKEDFGSFSLDLNTAVCEAVLDENNCLRAGVGDALAVEVLLKVLAGEIELNEKNETPPIYTTVTPENAQDYIDFLHSYDF